MSQKIIDAIIAVLPEASFDVDNYGQVIIYTNKSEDENGNWVPFVEESEDNSEG